MAELHVQPKKNSMWLWIILALVALAIIYFLMKGNNKEETTVQAADTAIAPADIIATTQPDYENVDMNAPRVQYDEVTDADVIVQEKDNYIIYGLGDNILFATDQSTIQPNATAHLQQIAGSLNKRFKNASVAVYGRTDATGSQEHNKDLGGQRAAAVAEWLTGNGNVDKGKVSIHSFGELKPVATNSTEAGKQENRSVQIVVFKDNN